MTTIVPDPIKRWIFGEVKGSERRPLVPKLPKDAPESVHEAYRQACFLLHHSPRASGALTRYSLQKIVRDFWRLSPQQQGTLGSEFDLINDWLCEETRLSIQSVRRFGSVDAQLSQDRDMLVETTYREARLLIALLQLLSQEWYENRRRRRAHLEAIRAMAREAATASQRPAGAAASPEPAAAVPPEACPAGLETPLEEEREIDAPGVKQADG